MPRHALGTRECERYAARHHGVIPRWVALQVGHTDSSIGRLLANGRWRTLFPRVYVVAGAPITWRTHLAGVTASLETGFAFSHRTAGALMGLDEIPEDHVEVIAPNTPRLPGVIVHRIRGPLPQVLHVEGFPVTSAHRTALDLFAVLSRRTAELALEDALRKKLTTIDRLWTEYQAECRRGRNGCRPFRNAVLRRDHRDGTLQSRMEAKLRKIVQRLPGSSAVPQFEVQTPERRYFIDFAFPDIKLGIEAQSIRWHMGDAKSSYDLRRHRRLTRCGWTLLYYGWDDLLDGNRVREEITGTRRMLEAF